MQSSIRVMPGCYITGQAAGMIKPVNGLGQPPFQGLDFSLFHYLTEAGIPFSRLHDVGGMYGGSRFVDIPNAFPDFEKDSADPASSIMTVVTV